MKLYSDVCCLPTLSIEYILSNSIKIVCERYDAAVSGKLVNAFSALIAFEASPDIREISSTDSSFSFINPKQIQAEYATTEEKIRFAMRAEQHAKAETQMWRARLEKLSHEHREQLLRHANTLRIRLRKAESLLYFHQLKSERIGKSNMKLKGMIDAMKQDTNTITTERAKIRKNTERHLNEKLSVVAKELNRLKLKLTLKSCGVLPKVPNHDDISSEKFLSGHKKFFQPKIFLNSQPTMHLFRLQQPDQSYFSTAYSRHCCVGNPFYYRQHQFFSKRGANKGCKVQDKIFSDNTYDNHSSLEGCSKLDTTSDTSLMKLHLPSLDSSKASFKSVKRFPWSFFSFSNKKDDLQQQAVHISTTAEAENDEQPLHNGDQQSGALSISLTAPPSADISLLSPISTSTAAVERTPSPTKQIIGFSNSGRSRCIFQLNEMDENKRECFNDFSKSKNVSTQMEATIAFRRSSQKEKRKTKLFSSDSPQSKPRTSLSIQNKKDRTNESKLVSSMKKGKRYLPKLGERSSQSTPRRQPRTSLSPSSGRSLTSRRKVSRSKNQCKPFCTAAS